MNKLILFLALIICISCEETKQSVTLASVADSVMNKSQPDTSVHNTLTCHNYRDEVRRFDFLEDSIEIRLQYSCLDNSLVEKVNQNTDGKYERQFYNNYKILISFITGDINKDFVFMKEALADNADNNWLKECIIGNSFIDSFSMGDTSAFVSLFIGYPDSDNGVIANLKIGHNSGIKIINIVEPEFE